MRYIVAYLDQRTLALVHHNALLALKEGDEEQHQPHQCEDAHGDKPSPASLRCVINRLHLTCLWIQHLGCEEDDYQRQGLDDQSREIGHHHTHTGQNGDFVGIAGKRRAECRVWYIDERETHAHSNICYICVKQRPTEPVPEAERGKGRQQHGTQDQPRPILAPTGMRLVDDCPHHRIPNNVDDTDYEEHHGHGGRVESKYIIIIKE